MIWNGRLSPFINLFVKKTEKVPPKVDGQEHQYKAPSKR